MSIPACATPGSHAALQQINFSTEVTAESGDEFLSALKQVQARKPKAILLVINSIGGDTDVGWKMIAAIQHSPIPVHCMVDGEADSTAFLILQSCATRGISPLSALMTHQPYLELDTSQTGPVPMKLSMLHTWTNRLAADAEKVAIFCASRMKMPLAEYMKRVDDIDWTMGSATGLERHAVDYINTVDRVRANLEAGRAPGAMPLQP